MPLLKASESEIRLLRTFLRGGDTEECLANDQLQRELDQTVKYEASLKYVDGVNQSPLFQRLPMEIRHQIWSYLVVVPESIHVYPVKRNVKQGFRLSRCGDVCMNLRNGWCECNNDGISANPNPPVYLDTESLLVS
jgi:2EXR family